MRRAPLPLVVARGTPDQIGRTYGHAARPQIAANLDAYFARFAELGAAAARVRELGEHFRAATRAHCPRVAAMLDGVAAGAGCTTGAIYALNARTELLMGLSLGVLDGGCTTLGVGGARTADGHTLLAQNWDWAPAQRETMLLLATRDERGHAVLTLAEAGMLAKAGLNSAGIGVCVNILASDRDGRGDGVPYHAILRAALESTTLAQAALAAAAVPRSASVHLLLGAVGGELVSLELAPDALACAWPQDGALAHANHFEHCREVDDLILGAGDPAASSLARGRRAQALLERLAAEGDVTEQALADVLRDHEGLPICVHETEPSAPALEQETLVSLLLDLDARVLSVAAGPPCRAGYERIALDELLPQV